MNNVSLAQSFKRALEGLAYSVRKHRHTQIILSIALAVIVLSFFLKLSIHEYMILSFTISLVIVAELANTAIEHSIDLFTISYHPLAKAAKDISAAAVLISAINALIIAALFVWSRLR
ncbi:MAG: diacylglycerol kinase family protein [Actinomycetota bacterium]